MNQSSNKEAAIRLAGLGLRIFPCNAKKKPIIKAWEQCEVSSPLTVSATWDENALPALLAGGNGFVVIDCDRKPGKPDGVAAFTELCASIGVDLSQTLVIETPSGGYHFYWRSDVPFGNSSGSLPLGVDVRGIGGYVIAPGAVMPDGRGYRIVQGSWDSVPTLPEPLAALLKPKDIQADLTHPISSAVRPEATERERQYAETALQNEIEKLTAMREGSGRNAALNNAALHLGEMVRAGWIERRAVEQALWEASDRNGYRAKDGDREAWKTLQSGLESGIAKPRDPLPIDDVPQWFRDSVTNWINAHKAKQASTVQKQQFKRSVSVVQCSTIQAKPVTWLWGSFIPQGKLTLLAGAGGTGKSTLAFNFAATVSNGGKWPDGSPCNAAGNVLIWSSEDDAADTITPRLMAVEANLSHCGIISGAIDENGFRCPFDASRDMDQLCEAVNRIGGVSLLIIDPIVTAITGDMHKANDVRRSLQAIVDFAAETNCAVVGITHFAKGTAGKNSAERVIGSQAFAALARMVLVAAKEENSERRVFTRAKSNNSVDTGGFSYSIEAIALHSGITATRIVWGDPLEGSSRSILATVESDTDSEEGKLGTAKKFLIEMLRNGPVTSRELFEYAREGYGVSTNTLRRAQKDLGIIATKATFAGGWMWSLPLANPSR